MNKRRQINVLETPNIYRLYIDYANVVTARFIRMSTEQGRWLPLYNTLARWSERTPRVFEALSPWSARLM